MAIISEIKQQGPQVRVKTINPPGGATITGKLVGHKKSGFVLLMNSTYKMYEAPARLVASVSAALWPKKKWDYKGIYF